MTVSAPAGPTMNHRPTLTAAILDVDGVLSHHLMNVPGGKPCKG